MTNKKRILAVIMALMMMVFTAALAETAETAETAATPETAETAEPAAAAQEATPVYSIGDTQRLDAIYTLALNAINKEDYATAQKYLNICFVYCNPQTSPEMYADLLLKQACINEINEEYSLALLGLDAVLALQPDLADAYLVRAQIYSKQSDLTSAVSNLEKYIELSQDTSLLETVAQLHEANGNMEAAQAAYDKFAETAGTENQEVGFQAGLYRMDNGKYAEAIEAFQPYVDDETYGAGAQYNIGVCKMNTGDYAGAIEAFTACETKGGTFQGLYYNRGLCYMLSENWASGADDFARSIESEPYVADARYNLAICNMQQGEYEAAVAAFDELVKSTEGQEDLILNDAVYYFRAESYAAMGKLEEAIKDFTLCIEHGYELAQTYYERAQVYAAMGDTENQTSDLENALKYAN